MSKAVDNIFKAGILLYRSRFQAPSTGLLCESYGVLPSMEQFALFLL